MNNYCSRRISSALLQQARFFASGSIKRRHNALRNQQLLEWNHALKSSPWWSSVRASSATALASYTTLEQRSSEAIRTSASAREVEGLLDQWCSLVSQLDGPDLDQAVESMRNLYDTVQQSKDLRSSRVFQRMLHVYGHIQPNGRDALIVLEHWNDMWMGDLEQAPLRQHYHSVLAAYASAASDVDDIVEGASVAIEILKQLEQWGYTMRPNLLTYSMATSCMFPVLRLDDPQSSAFVKEEFEGTLIPRLKTELSKSETAVSNEEEPDSSVWIAQALGCIVRYISLLDQTKHDEHASLLHNEMIDWMQRWMLAVSSHSVSRDTPAAQRDHWIVHSHETVEAFLRHLEISSEKLAQKHPNIAQLINESLLLLEATLDDSTPLTESYYRAVKIAARNDGVVPNEVVESWLVRMYEMHQNRVTGQELASSEISKSWNCMMMAYLELKLYGKVLETWNEMGRSVPKLRDSISFRVILKALAEQSNFVAAERAHSIWKKMVAPEPSKRFFQPALIHYELPMIAWSNTGDRRSHQFCQEIMDHLQAEAKENPAMKPTLAHYAALIGSQGWALKDPSLQNQVFSSIRDLRNSGLVLDANAYKACFAALVRVQSVEGAMLAQSMLNEMIESGLVPNALTFQAVMRAWAESSSDASFEHCHDLLEQMQSLYRESRDAALRPTSHCYTSLIMALTKVSGDGAKAEKVLDFMQEAARQGMAEDPARSVYTAVMSAYFKQGKFNHVDRIFNRMKSDYANGNVEASPDSRAFAIIMHSLAKSSITDKVSRTRQFLSQLCEEYDNGNLSMKPSSQCFGAVLNACVFCNASESESAKESVIHVAVATMADMETYLGGPNEYAYWQMFHILGRHLTGRADRERLAGLYFQKCSQDGLVSNRVIAALRRHLPELYHKLPHRGPQNALQLPPNWTRNLADFLQLANPLEARNDPANNTAKSVAR